MPVPSASPTLPEGERPGFRFSAELLQLRPPALTLRDLTPTGAPALRCWPYGLGGWNAESGRWDRNFGFDAHGIECVLPLISPPAVDGPPWIEGALAAVVVDGKSLNVKERELLAATLDPHRARRMPHYEAHGPEDGAEATAAIGTLRRREPGTAPADYEPTRGRMVFREPVEYVVDPVDNPAGVRMQFRVSRWIRHDRPPGQRRGIGRNATRPLRDVLVAVAWDLMGCRVDEIGEVLLGAVPGDFDASLNPSYAWRSKAYEVRARGRSILAQLGCWPWALAPDGMLPRTWRSNEAYAVALNTWMARAT